jgi:hypothetical protein
MKWTIGLAMLGAAVPALSRADTLPVVGLDREGKQVGVALESGEYARVLGDIVSTVHDSALSALGRQASSSSSAADTEWMLRDVVIGVGVTFSAGLGPIYSATAAPRVRLCYSNSTHPKFPD